MRHTTNLEDAGLLCGERKSDKKEFFILSANNNGTVMGSAEGKIENMRMEEVTFFRKKDGVRV